MKMRIHHIAYLLEEIWLWKNCLSLYFLSITLNRLSHANYVRMALDSNPNDSSDQIGGRSGVIHTYIHIKFTYDVYGRLILNVWSTIVCGGLGVWLSLSYDLKSFECELFSQNGCYVSTIKRCGHIRYTRYTRYTIYGILLRLPYTGYR